MNSRATSENAQSSHWESYWSHLPADRGAQDAAVTGAARSETFRALWAEFFQQSLNTDSCIRIADLGCGGGVLIDQALKLAGKNRQGSLHLVGADYAASAAAQVQAKNHSCTYARISGVAADVASVPFSDNVFDLTISQFGVEYAGYGAFEEIARMTAKGGSVMCISHYAEGSIAQECARNLTICEALSANALLQKGAAIFRGRQSIEESLVTYKSAVEALRPLAIEAAPSSAKDFMIRIVDDLGRMIARRQAFAPQDVLAWIDGMSREVALYADRMRAMVNAALDEGAVARITDIWRNAGFDVEAPCPVTLDDHDKPAAWRLSAKRS